MALEIVRQVKDAYIDVLPGLPYTELPVISVSGKVIFAIMRTIHALITFGTQLRVAEALFYKMLPLSSKMYPRKTTKTALVLC